MRENTTLTKSTPVVGTAVAGAALAAQNWLAAVVLFGGSEPHAAAARVHLERWHLNSSLFISPRHLQFLQVKKLSQCNRQLACAPEVLTIP